MRSGVYVTFTQAMTNCFHNIRPLLELYTRFIVWLLLHTTFFFIVLNLFFDNFNSKISQLVRMFQNNLRYELIFILLT